VKVVTSQKDSRHTHEKKRYEANYREALNNVISENNSKRGEVL